MASVMSASLPAVAADDDGDARVKLEYSVCGGDVRARDRDATREASLESVRESDEVMKTTAERLVKDSKETGDMGDRGSTLSAAERKKWYERGVRVRKTAVQDEATAVLLERLRSGGRASAELACGCGKTRLGVRVVEALVRDQYATASEAVYVVVLVPTLALMPQTVSEWYERYQRPECPFECEVRSVCSLSHLSREEKAEACGDASVEKMTKTLPPKWNVVVDDVTDLREWLHETPTYAKPLVRLIVSTYHSVEKVSQAFHRNNMQDKIALTIFDEAHVTCLDKKNKKKSPSKSSTSVDFSLALRDTRFDSNENIDGMSSQRRLFMTATRRVPKGTKVRRSKDGDAPEEMAASMDDVGVYGECVFRLPMERAIELGLIRDYVMYCVLFRPKEGYEASVKGQSAEQKERENFTKKLLALTKAMKKRDAHKGFVFMSKIDLVDEALKIASGMPWSGLDVRNPLFVKNHSEQKGHMTRKQFKETFKTASMDWNEPCDTPKKLERDVHFKLFESATRGNHELVLMFNVRSLGIGVNVPDARAEAILSGMSTPEGLTQAIGRVMRHNAKDPRPGARAILLLPYEMREEEECEPVDGFGDENGGRTRERASSSKGEGETSAKPKKRSRKPNTRSDADAKTCSNVLSALAAADSRMGNALRLLKRGQNMVLETADVSYRVRAMADLSEHLKFECADESESIEASVLRLRDQVYEKQLELVSSGVSTAEALEALHAYLKEQLKKDKYWRFKQSTKIETPWATNWNAGKWISNRTGDKAQAKSLRAPMTKSELTSFDELVEYYRTRERKP